MPGAPSHALSLRYAWGLPPGITHEVKPRCLTRNHVAERIPEREYNAYEGTQTLR